MLAENEWRLDAKCASLSPDEADALFFGERGSKPHKAKVFCTGCPVRMQCLSEAIVNKAQGFQLGLTEDERRHMRVLIAETRSLVMPDEPDGTQRKIYLKIFGPSEDHSWMDEVDAPDTLLAALDEVSPMDPAWEAIPVAS